MMLELRFRKSVSRRWIGFGLLALLFSLTPGFLIKDAQAQTRPQAPVPLPVPFNPIVDNANVIDADTRKRLESIYLNLQQRAQIEFAVLTVQTTGDLDIFDFSLAVARGWNIGPKDGDRASFLLVVAIQDRKYRTEVSRHLEGDLNDGLVGQIQRERLVPAFKQGNYSKGIFDTIQAYVATLGAKRGFNIDGIDQRYAYRTEQPTQARRSGKSLSTTCCGIAVVLFIIIAIAIGSRGGGGRGGRRGRGGDGLAQALLWGTLLSNLGGGSRGSGWSGGGFGGSSGGGGGGGFGGGFGGGGDFGGGGAGGSW